MMLNRKINSSDIPQTVNEMLMNKWGISLFKFSQVFAVSPADAPFRRLGLPFKLRDVKAVLETVDRMQNDILQGARQLHKFFHGGQTEFSEKKFMEETGIRAFFLDYLYPRQILATFYELMLGTKRGKRINNKTIIAVGWGNLVSQTHDKVDWRTLGDLYYWFWERLASYPVYKEWTPVAGIENYLKVQFTRYRLPRGLKRFVNSNLHARELDNKLFLYSHLILRLGRRVVVPTGRFPIPFNELPRVLLDAWTNLLTSNEGLSLFFKEGSFSDPLFAGLYSSLGMKEQDAPLIGSVLPGAEYIIEWIRRHSDIEEKYNYVRAIYRKLKADIDNLPPMIVFPDSSFFTLKP
jgi:hypothetical protein